MPLNLHTQFRRPLVGFPYAQESEQSRGQKFIYTSNIEGTEKRVRERDRYVRGGARKRILRVRPAPKIFHPTFYLLLPTQIYNGTLSVCTAAVQLGFLYSYHYNHESFCTQGFFFFFVIPFHLCFLVL